MKHKIAISATVPAFKSVEFLMQLANAGELSRRAAEMVLDAYFAGIDQKANEQFPETTKGR